MGNTFHCTFHLLLSLGKGALLTGGILRADKKLLTCLPPMPLWTIALEITKQRKVKFFKLQILYKHNSLLILMYFMQDTFETLFNFQIIDKLIHLISDHLIQYMWNSQKTTYCVHIKKTDWLISVVPHNILLLCNSQRSIEPFLICSPTLWWISG